MCISFEQMGGRVSGVRVAEVLVEDLGLGLVERTPFRVWLR